MSKTWDQASKELKEKLLNRNVEYLRESFDLQTFRRNPKRFFNDNGWVIPKEDFEEIVNALADLANSDSDISFEGVELGKRGEYVQEVVQKLMTTDEDFARAIKKIAEDNHITEGKLGKGVAIALTCLALLAGVGIISSTEKTTTSTYPSSLDYSSYVKNYASEYAKTLNTNEDGTLSGWKSFNFVDDFGDPTDNTGIKCSAYDTSNKKTHTVIIERNNQSYLISFKLEGLYMSGYSDNDTDFSIKVKTSSGEIKEYLARYSTSTKRVYFKYTSDNNSVLEFMKDTCHIIIKVFNSTKFDIGSIGVSSSDLGKVHSAYSIEQKTSEIKKEEVKNNEVKNEIKKDDKDLNKEETKDETTTETKKSSLRKLPVQAKRELNDAYAKMIAGKMFLKDFYTFVHKICAEYLGQTFPVQEINEYFGIE